MGNTRKYCQVRTDDMAIWDEEIPDALLGALDEGDVVAVETARGEFTTGEVVRLMHSCARTYPGKVRSVLSHANAQNLNIKQRKDEYDGVVRELEEAVEEHELVARAAKALGVKKPKAVDDRLINLMVTFAAVSDDGSYASLVAKEVTDQIDGGEPLEAA